MTTAEKIIKYTASTFAAFLAVGIVVIILEFGMSIIHFFSGSNSDVKDDNTTYSASEIKCIKIDSKPCDLSIKESSTSDEITIEAENVSTSYTCELTDEGELIIDNKDISHNLFGLFNNKVNITLYLPDNFVLDDFTAKIAIGDINIDTLDTDSCTIKNGVGDVNIENFNVVTTEMNLGIGDVNIENSTIKNGNIENGIGDITMNLYGDIEDYDIVLNNGLGDHEINGNSHKKYYGSNAKYEIKYNSGIGDCEIKIDK